MGRFGPTEGLILLALQLIAVAIVLRPAGFPLTRIGIVALATYLAAFIAHIIGFILLPDDAPKLLTRPVISLVWFMASMLACLPFTTASRGLALRCGLLCTLAYLAFAFAFDYIKPA